MSNEFQEFPKLPRLSREMIVTEKIDGTNGQIFITDEGDFLVGSRNRYLTKETDNAGFHRWATDHAEELFKLGPGRHFGEWWGKGIQRGYGINEKRFSLFNVSRWTKNPAQVKDKVELAPGCCHIIPILYTGIFSTERVDIELMGLKTLGSVAAPGFMNPEGVVAWHVAGNFGLKKTIEKDESPKSCSI